MFQHRFDSNTGTKVILHWFLLSANGGAINAGGFLATGKFVSHVTGFATLFGVEISEQKVDIALGFLSVPLFFLLGAFLAGFLIDRPLFEGKRPHFDWVMGMSAACLCLVAAGGGIIHLAAFGDLVGLKESYLLLILLCLASGLQNGAITSSSGASVRTTHLTGLTTDLGLGLARTLSSKRNAKLHHSEWRANFLRIGSIVSFVFGSALGAFVFIHFGYQGFFLPALIATYVAWQGRKQDVT